MADEAPLIKCPNCGKMNRVRPAASGVPHCGSCGAALPWLTDSSEADFPAVVEQSTIPVLVDFWAPWCGPCKSIAPIVEEIAGQFEGKLKVAKLNVDDHPATASRYGIRGIPNLIILKAGAVKEQIVGAVPKAKLVSAIEKALL